MDVASATLGFTSTVLGTDVAPPTQDVRSLTTQLRMVKSPAEIALIQKATDASIASQLAGMRAIRPGVRERTVAGVEIATMLAEGCERPSYPPIVGSGINSTVLHYSENSKTMDKGEVVVIDAAGEYSMYASDLTRTMPVDGHFSARQREIYNIVLGAQQAARDAFVAGKSKMGSVDHAGNGRRGKSARRSRVRLYQYPWQRPPRRTSRASISSTVSGTPSASMCMIRTTTTSRS